MLLREKDTQRCGAWCMGVSYLAMKLFVALNTSGQPAVWYVVVVGGGLSYRYIDIVCVLCVGKLIGLSYVCCVGGGGGGETDGTTNNIDQYLSCNSCGCKVLPSIVEGVHFLGVGKGEKEVVWVSVNEAPV